MENNRIASDFQHAWRSSQGNSFSDRLSRMSLQASIQDDPILEAALREVSNEGVAVGSTRELDFKITGPGVTGHSTDAGALGKFYQAIAECAESINRSLSGIKIPGMSLQAIAPYAGSVRIAFSEPPGWAQESIPGLKGFYADESALRILMGVLSEADSGDVEALVARTGELPKRARDAFKEVARLAIDTSWIIEGTLGRGRKQTARAVLTMEGAARLKLATESIYSKMDPITEIGTADGWVWSSGRLRFLPQHGRPFTATVPVPLQSEVASLISEDNRTVKASFLRTQVIPQGSKSPAMTTYSLSEIEAIPD